jgi:preprotein translocase subunit SecE
MAKDQAAGAPGARWGRKPSKGRPAQSPVISGDEQDAPKKKGKNLVEWVVGLPQFFREVRVEGRKITWPSRKETWITSVMVCLMILITIGFFFVVDLVTGWVVGHLIKLGS